MICWGLLFLLLLDRSRLLLAYVGGWNAAALRLLVIHVILPHLVKICSLLLLLSCKELLLLLIEGLAWTTRGHHHAHVVVEVSSLWRWMLSLHKLHGHCLVVLVVLSHHLLLLLRRHSLKHSWRHHHLLLVVHCRHALRHTPATHYHLVELLSSLQLIIVNLTKVRGRLIHRLKTLGTSTHHSSISIE